jgi:hypothetical protein
MLRAAVAVLGKTLTLVPLTLLAARRCSIPGRCSFAGALIA